MKHVFALVASLIALTAVADQPETEPSPAPISPTPVPFVVANCLTEDFHVDANPEAVIEFGYERGYSRRCLKVKPGTKVTIAASNFHPLQAIAPIAGVENPFLMPNAARAPQTRVLVQPGIYGFYCRAHSDEMGNGMAGAIWVAE